MVRPLTVRIILFIGVVPEANEQAADLMVSDHHRPWTEAIIADSLAKLDSNKTSIDVKNHLKKIETRRLAKAKKARSTSSSSGDKDGSKSSDDEDDKESLQLSSDGGGSNELFKAKKLAIPKSSVERRGWRKWHRKCQACPEDMSKKWRDPTIKWICGAYQRARRSFKSACMMHYRNCQDGTMFTEIYDGRCKNDTPGSPPHGDHFFYDYRVVLSGDSADTSESAHKDSGDISY